MSQTTNYYTDTVMKTASNLGVAVTTVETPLLEVPFTGFSSFGFLITNSSESANNINAINIYISPNGVDYLSYDGLNIAAVGETSYTSMSMLVEYIRITAISDGTSTVDVHLNCAP